MCDDNVHTYSKVRITLWLSSISNLISVPSRNSEAFYTVILYVITGKWIGGRRQVSISDSQCTIEWVAPWIHEHFAC